MLDHEIDQRKKIFISAGELSGDLHGSFLIRALKGLHENIDFIGMGGFRMASEGVQLATDLTHQSTVGFLGWLRYLPWIVAAMRRAKRMIYHDRPDLVVLIDSAGFHLPLAKFAKRYKIPVIYFITPEYWCWGTSGMGLNITQNVDKILSILKVEDKFYRDLGGDVEYVGHPAPDYVRRTKSREEFRNAWGIESEMSLIGIFPGSREQEIKRMLPLLLKTVEYLHDTKPLLRFLISSASGRSTEEIKKMCRRLSSSVSVVENDTHNLLSACDFALLKSGTVSVEAALLKVPHVALYKCSFLDYFFAKYILLKLFRIGKHPKFISLVNLVLDEEVVPEFIQYGVKPKEIAKVVLRSISDENILKNTSNKFQIFHQKIGGRGCYAKAAGSILNILEYHEIPQSVFKECPSYEVIRE